MHGCNMIECLINGLCRPDFGGLTDADVATAVISRHKMACVLESGRDEQLRSVVEKA